MIRLICYDITEDKSRNRLSALLEEQGFERIQYSIFVGQISAARWDAFWSRLERFFKERCSEKDRIYSHMIEQA